jgi:CRISPR-associated protein Cmr6
MSQPRDGSLLTQRQSKEKIPRPILANVCAIIGDKEPTTSANSCHPGLWLDKFTRPGDQKVQREEINWVCSLSEILSRNDGASILKEARARREKNLAALGADKWAFIAQTTGPFALHLARAAALENAGICLHSVYGFPLIPGSALKGMAHAYACEVWSPMQNDKKAAWDQICEVFGWAPSPWLRKLAEEHGVMMPKGESSGAIVFHDAWPREWPKLICDIVNNHHPKYYGGEHTDPPGDWENPVPVYFLAVVPGAAFDFPLSWRSVAALNAQQDEESAIKLACQWLLGALVHRGAGAKTNTGYGRFQLREAPAQYADIKRESVSLWQKATNKESGVFCEETFILELVSPAFLAGAKQQAADCDLRPATLRGHLRWWWRTMHAGYLDVANLKRLEDAIWGSAEEGGAVSIEITPKTMTTTPTFNKREVSKAHDLESPPNKKTTQGLSYLAFGMDDIKTENQLRVQRSYVDPLNQWEVVFLARSVTNSWHISAKNVLEEALNAFSLFCIYGGIGAKSRKGFGSMAVPGNLARRTLENCRESAMKVRQSLGIDSPFDKEKMHSSSVREIIEKEIKTPWKNVWYALDHLGYSYQSFAQSRKHSLEKKALGLPRRIGSPHKDRFNPTGFMRDLGESARHPSPFFFHLERNTNQTYSIRVAAFPSRYLPKLDTSRKILQELLEHLDKDLHERASRYNDKGQNPPVPSGPAIPVPGIQSASPPSGASLPRVGERVEATLLEGKTKKGGWKARHTATGIGGPVQNTADVPPDKKHGDAVMLIVKNANEREIGFRYPTEADDRQARSPKRG